MPDCPAVPAPGADPVYERLSGHFRRFLPTAHIGFVSHRTVAGRDGGAA